LLIASPVWFVVDAISTLRRTKTAVLDNNLPKTASESGHKL